MNNKCEINSRLWLRNATALNTPLYRVLGAFVLASFLLAGVSRHFASAVSLPPASQGMDPAKAAATIKANALALKGFTYQQRVQLQLKGETKKVTLNQMSYDMNGNEQKTLLSEQPSADSSPQQSSGGRGGRLKQKVVAKKTGEFKQMMGEIAALVKSYTQLPPDVLQGALKQGSLSQGQGDMQGAIQIQMRNVIRQGDSLTLWIDQNALLFRRAVIATVYEGNPVTTTANYAMLPTGQVYMAQSILNYPKKQVVVEIDNMNYQRSQ